MADLPLQKQYNLTHFQQRYNWDCGISCILMILTSTQREEFLRNFDSICEKEGFQKSTWTIDLSYLLLRFDIKHEYYTKTIGVDPSYRNNSYYTEVIIKDSERVIRKFKDAAQNGLHVEKSTLLIDKLIGHIARHGPVIVLTNASQLICDICNPKRLEEFGRYLKRSCFSIEPAGPRLKPKSYSGHYVVMSGYDLDRGKVFYHNPEVHDGHVCTCSLYSLDRARKAYGTDEDVILIFYK